MIKKIIYLGVILVMCLGILSACVDYGYEFHFSVVGGNGTIVYRWRVSPDSEWHEFPSPVMKLGNKKGHQIELTAFPDDGYQVKEWTCDGNVVEGNKSNSFTAIAIDYKHNKVTVTVEFEPIPTENQIENKWEKML